MKIEPLSVRDAQTVNSFEKRLGFQLPSDYKGFLSKFNGARVIDGYFFVDDLNQQIMMHVFYGLNQEEALDLEFWLKEFADDIPEKSLLIGRDPGGGLILLINNGEDDGIYYYDHSYFFDQSSDEINSYLITENFESFLRMLETEQLKTS